MNENIFKAVEKLALSKIECGKDIRDLVDPGNYAIDVGVHVRGGLKVGKDYESRIVAKCDPWGLLTVALSKLNNVTLNSILQEALLLQEDAERVQNVKKEAQEVIQTLKNATLQKNKGKVTSTLEVEKILVIKHPL